MQKESKVVIVPDFLDDDLQLHILRQILDVLPFNVTVADSPDVDLPCLWMGSGVKERYSDRVPVQGYFPNVNYMLINPDTLLDFKAKVTQLAIYTSYEPYLNPKVAVNERDIQLFHKLLKGHYSMNVVAVDIETTGLDPWEDEILCIGIAVDEQTHLIIPRHLLYTEAANNLLTDSEIKWLAHNSQFDLLFIEKSFGYCLKATEDTMLLHYALDERIGTHGLKSLCQEYLFVDDWEADIKQYVQKPKVIDTERKLKNLITRTRKKYADTQVLFELDLNPNNPTVRLCDYALYIIEEDVSNTSTFHELMSDRNTRLVALKFKPVKNKASYEYIPVDMLHKYLTFDIVYTSMLYRQLCAHVAILQKDMGKDIIHIYRHSLKLSDMYRSGTTTGVLVRTDGRPQELKAELDTAVEDYKNILCDLVGSSEFNPGSWQQVQNILYTKLKLPDHNEGSTDQNTLRQLATKDTSGFVNALIEYKKVSKIANTSVPTFIDYVKNDGRVHATFNIHGTVTGRASSSNPNIWNIPRPTKNAYAQEIRNLVTCPDGYMLVGADFNQMEYVLAGQFSKDPFYIDVYTNGRDLHSEAAIMLFGEHFTPEQRSIAKTLNFGLIYGLTPYGMSQGFNMPVAEAEDIYDSFFAKIPKLAQWLHSVQEQAANTGLLRTPFGRYRRFGFVFDESDLENIPYVTENRKRVNNQGPNFLIQSTAAEINKFAALQVHEWLQSTGYGRFLMTLYDAIYLEVKEEYVEIVEQVLEETMIDSVEQVIGEEPMLPFTVDIHSGKYWGEL